MKNIKLIYDWYGPNYPLINNQVCLEEALIEARTKKVEDYYLPINNNVFPFRTLNMFKGMEGYIYSSSSDVLDGDYFIYELTLHMDASTWLKNADLDILCQTQISDFLIKQIKTKNGYILIDTSNESPNAYLFYDVIHNYFNSKNIPLNKIIFLTGCANSKEIYKKYCNHYKISGRNRIIIEGFEWYEMIASKDLNEVINEPIANDNYYKIQKTFLCYNRRFKPHRTDLYILFFMHGLLSDSYYSMPVTADDPSEISWIDNFHKECDDFNDHARKFKKMLISLYHLNEGENLSHINGQLPLRIDNAVTLVDMIKLLNTSQTLYDTSLISVITESNFYGEDVFNTEKTWKAIANKHPFILVGPYKSLYYLRELGYKTFSDFFDESYDDTENPCVRLLKIIALCKKINNWSDTKKKDFFNECTRITEYNYNLLKSKYNDNKRNDFMESFYKLTVI
jgi:hypothetical protein